METQKAEINFKVDDNASGVNVGPAIKKLIYEGIFECQLSKSSLTSENVKFLESYNSVINLECISEEFRKRRSTILKHFAKIKQYKILTANW